MNPIKEVAGVEFTREGTIIHEKWNLKGAFWWLTITILMVGILFSCNEEGMYQGPDDDMPSYGRTK